MPLYEYQCDACGHQFEVIRKFSDEPLTACPKCGGAVQKLVSSPAFQFKGSGWYATDYPKKSETGKSEKSDSASGESKDTAAKGDKESGSKDSGSKDSGSKDSTSSSGKESPATPAAKTS